MSDVARAAIRELSRALLALHRRGLTITQQSFEKLHGRVRGPGELLQLVVNDPLFAWLRPLSQEIVALDELADSDEIAQPELDAARASVIALLETNAEFRGTYLVYLQDEPDLVLAHAAVRKLLASQPQPSADAD